MEQRARTSRLKQLLTWAFRVMALLALVYFLTALVGQWHAISEWRPTAQQVLTLLTLVLGYGVGLFLLAEMWHALLQALGEQDVPRRVSYPSYTTTQIAKYLPGNVFHLVGRHAWLAGSYVTHGRLVSATILEAGMLVAAAGCISLLFFTLADFAGLPLPRSLASFAPLLPWAILLIGVVAVALWIWASHRHWLRTMLRALPRAMALSGVFFVWQGIIFATIVSMFEPGIVPLAVAISAFAWVVGFIVPGAPGGLGIRETVLLLFLSPVIAEADAALAIALARVVTTLGDLVCFCLGRSVAQRLLDGAQINIKK